MDTRTDNILDEFIEIERSTAVSAYDEFKPPAEGSTRSAGKKAVEFNRCIQEVLTSRGAKV